MKDKQEKVEETKIVETPEVEADASTPADAGGVPEPTPEDASRTGYAKKGLRAGDACVCPDGRTGTVHKFDAGFVCIPNHEQG